MKKLLITALIAASSLATYAGGLMTNTNYHIAFDRMMARGATFDIDAAYSNPAGIVWGHDGWQLSLNFQKPWQNRDITTTVPNYLAVPAGMNPLFPNGYAGVNIDKKFNGKASAPIVPALFAAYKKDKWAVSAMIGIVGSGGFVKYDDGIPMFNLMTMGKIFEASVKAKAAAPTDPTKMIVTPEMYNISSTVKGKQYIYGAQLNFTYKLADYLSAAVGIRANYYDGYNRGYVTATTLENLGSQQLMDLQLDVTQRAFGIAPIVSVNYHKGPLTVAARYEFRTKINTKNTTDALSVTMMGQTTDIKATAAQIGNEKTLAALAAAMGDEMAGKIKNYMPDENVRYDMPSLFVAAVGYEFSPKLRATLEYHFFDDKNAKMADDRQKELKHGTHEILAGVEYDINEKFTVSCGAQRTDYGLSDGYQQNTSFACDSYSIGLGGAWNISDKLRLNAGYFITLYSDYTHNQEKYLGTNYAGKDVYSRTNNVIGVGIDYKF